MPYPAINIAINIHASAERIWDVLTQEDLMKQWMGEDFNLSITCNWKRGSVIEIRGEHYGPFTNKGLVLISDYPYRLSYTHLSSVSQLGDEAQNYSVLDFNIQAVAGYHELSVTLKNFPTDSIYKHFQLYWKGTLPLIKQVAEAEAKT